MPMATKHKYDLESLEWDSEHRRNKEGVYCYCGLDYSDGDRMLTCNSCQQLFHWDCVGCLKIKPLLGDSFYQFKCSVCNGDGSEEYTHDTLSWVQVIYIVLYHLIKTEPEKQYFRWRENICATINDNWEGLMPGKAKTATWHNTVAGCLSTHNAMFRSGFDDTQQSGNWTLKEILEPASAKFKSRDTVAKAPKREKGTVEAKKPKAKSDAKKPALVEAGSEAEKEILEALGESMPGSKRSARHRVSFSDDDSDGGQSKPKPPKGKRRRPDPKVLDNDADLLQSLQLYQKLEMQHLGKTTSAAAAEPPDDKQHQDEEIVEASGTVMSSPSAKGHATEGLDSPCSSLSSWDTDSELGDFVPLDGKASRPDNGGNKLTSNANVAAIADSFSGATKEAGKSTSDKEDNPIVSTPPLTGKSPAANGQDSRVQTTIEELEASDDIGWTSLEGVDPQTLFTVDEPGNVTKKLAIMSDRAQWELGAMINSSRATMTCTARRLYRRLELRRYKRLLALPLFDIDGEVERYMRQAQIPWPDRDIDQRALDLIRGYGYDGNDEAGDDQVHSLDLDTDVNSGGDVVNRVAPVIASLAAEAEPVVIKTTAYANSFASRLMGRAVLHDSLTLTAPRIGPFLGRLMRPYIWRDWKSPETAPCGTEHKRPALPVLHVLHSIRNRQHTIFGKLGLEAGDPTRQTSGRESIDYVYFLPEHLRQVNGLLGRTFWPEIDMSEALQTPEFSIVALHKRNVVGCAFLTPDAYLTYIAVSAGWEGAGIARFMVYHLAQTVPTKDVTLHVSATNLAMLFYQRLGFKPEKLAVGFYKHYLPASSRLSPNAFFMRLRRH